jgi:hypothetical protein
MSDALAKLSILRDMLRSAFTEWKSEVWSRDLDSRWCCSGRECGCYGVTVRQVWLREEGDE